MKIDDAIREVSEELGIPFDVCREAYMASWRFIKDKAQSLPLMDDLSDEEFNELRPNFNLPSLGKLFVTQDNYRRKKNRLKIIKDFREKHGNDIQNKETETTV